MAELLRPWQPLQERTMRVTVPFVRLRMATASSWVTPSRLCPLTAMIWSPLFRRPSSAAAPCNYKVGLFTCERTSPHTKTKSWTRTQIALHHTHIAPGARTISHDGHTQKTPFLRNGLTLRFHLVVELAVNRINSMFLAAVWHSCWWQLKLIKTIWASA